MFTYHIKFHISILYSVEINSPVENPANLESQILKESPSLLHLPCSQLELMNSWKKKIAPLQIEHGRHRTKFQIVPYFKTK